VDRAERREFVRKHRTAVFGYNRKSDGPAQSIVYYVMDGDDLLVSTMGARAKAKAVERLGKVSLCVLDEQWPPSYLVVYCLREARDRAARRRRPDDADRGRDGRQAHARDGASDRRGRRATRRARRRALDALRHLPLAAQARARRERRRREAPDTDLGDALPW
jgi:hypothetical protein